MEIRNIKFCKKKKSIKYQLYIYIKYIFDTNLIYTIYILHFYIGINIINLFLKYYILLQYININI